VGEGPGDKTACGVPTQFGVIATHLWGYGDNIPFGTVMFVEGYGIGVVGDVGRLLKSDIDLCLDDYTIKDLLKARKLKNSTRRVWYIEP
jgi:3D (Asp-Asp-Asp) domain-containing protein